MPEPIELDAVDALGAGAVGEPGQRAFYIQARNGRRAAHGARREGAGRAARRPRPSRSSTASPTSTPRTRSTSLDAVGGAAARADGAAVPGPAHRARLRSRARARAHRAARAAPTTTTTTTTRRRRVDDDDDEGYVAAHLRDAGAGAGDGRARRRGGRRRPAAVPAVRLADGSRRAPVPPLELTRSPDELRVASCSRDGELEVVGRMRVLVERDVPRAALRRRRRRARRGLQAAARRAPALGLPRRHAVPPRGRGVRAVATRSGGASCPSPCCATARSASARCSASSTTTPRSTTSRCSRSTPTTSAQFAVFDVLANNTDRKGGHCLHDRAERRRSSASTTASPSTRSGSCAP